MGGFDDRYLAFAAGITCQRRGFCFRDLGVERGTSDKCSEDCFVLFFFVVDFFGGWGGDGGWGNCFKFAATSRTHPSFCACLVLVNFFYFLFL